jgi:transcriptional regulator with XRE-family HTH domain
MLWLVLKVCFCSSCSQDHDIRNTDYCQEKNVGIRNIAMINERIKIYIETKGLKLNKLSDITGVPHGSLSDIKNGKREPGAKILEKLIRNTDINAHWLLTGEGPMIRPESASSPNDQIAPDLRGGYNGTPELLRMIESLKAVMTSKNEMMKAALKSSLIAFESTVKDSEEVAGLRRGVKTRKRVVHPTDSTVEPIET